MIECFPPVAKTVVKVACPLDTATGDPLSAPSTANCTGPLIGAPPKGAEVIVAVIVTLAPTLTFVDGAVSAVAVSIGVGTTWISPIMPRSS